MRADPQPAPYRADPHILKLAGWIGDPVAGADFPATILRFRNQPHAATVGLAELDDDAWCSHFGRFAALPDNLPQPLALRYHGHQFRFDLSSPAQHRLQNWRIGAAGTPRTPFALGLACPTRRRRH